MYANPGKYKYDQQPWQTAIRLTEALVTDDVRVDLIKTGDHRLSEPDQLDVITKHIDEMIAKTSG